MLLELNIRAFGGLVSLVVTFAVIGVFWWLRQRRLNSWGEDLGFSFDGYTYRAQIDDREVELVVLDQAFDGLVHDQQRQLIVTASATVPAKMPDGMEIHSARYRGEIRGSEFVTGDDDFDARFRVSARDVASATVLLSQPGIINSLLNLGALYADLKLFDGKVHLRIGQQQIASNDPRVGLDSAYNAVMFGSDCLAWAAAGQPLTGGFAFDRPSSGPRGPLRLPNRRKVEG